MKNRYINADALIKQVCRKYDEVLSVGELIEEVEILAAPKPAKAVRKKRKEAEKIDPQEIRDLIYRSRFKQWQIAEQMGISEITLSRWLRKPLTEEQEARIKKAVEELREKGNDH